jgi:hypothetical protein
VTGWARGAYAADIFCVFAVAIGLSRNVPLAMELTGQRLPVAIAASAKRCHDANQRQSCPPTPGEVAGGLVSDRLAETRGFVARHIYVVPRTSEIRFKIAFLYSLDFSDSQICLRTEFRFKKNSP